MAIGVSLIGPLISSATDLLQPGQRQQWFFDIGFSGRAISFTADPFKPNAELLVDNIRHVLAGSQRRVLIDVTNVGSVPTDFSLFAGLIHTV
jgi:hypothetical protein